MCESLRGSNKADLCDLEYAASRGNGVACSEVLHFPLNRRDKRPGKWFDNTLLVRCVDLYDSP